MFKSGCVTVSVCACFPLRFFHVLWKVHFIFKRLNHLPENETPLRFRKTLLNDECTLMSFCTSACMMLSCLILQLSVLQKALLDRWRQCQHGQHRRQQPLVTLHRSERPCGWVTFIYTLCCFILKYELKSLIRCFIPQCCWTLESDRSEAFFKCFLFYIIFFQHSCVWWPLHMTNDSNVCHFNRVWFGQVFFPEDSVHRSALPIKPLKWHWSDMNNIYLIITASVKGQDILPSKWKISSQKY